MSMSMLILSVHTVDQTDYLPFALTLALAVAPSLAAIDKDKGTILSTVSKSKIKKIEKTLASSN